jgi:DMSO/TMAO reductase YedYZ molybdopterin-dependent catalytic subunit
MAIPQTEVTMDTRCVTRWSKLWQEQRHWF